ncbi:MAG: hypothetical protein RL398_3448 [Planctomycetota bacterium]
MIVAAILAIVASIGVPQYRSALQTARVQKARQELVTIAGAVDGYRARFGYLPLTLYQVGFGGRVDPWGTAYCYLNYGDGTGDGLEWAVELGIVDPSALKTEASASAAPAPAPSPAGGTVRGAGGIPIAPTQLAGSLLTVVEGELTRELTLAEVDAAASTFKDLKGEELYAGVTVEAVRRRDRYMFPLNTDYDLFSLGANRSTAVSLGQTLSQDDVIRANDGGFFGRASEY